MNTKNGKLKFLAIVFAFIILGSVIPVNNSPIETSTIAPVEVNKPADVAWSEDFDDGNISDWGIYGIVAPWPYTSVPGNFSVEDGALRANGTGEVWSIANTSSKVAYGTWTFDVDVVASYNHEIVIPFLMLKWTLVDWGIDCYFLQIVTGVYEDDPQPRLQAGKTYAANINRHREVVWFGSYAYDDMLGWKHFIITREDNGQFYVYMNGTLALGFKDNQHTTCNEFVFSTGPGPAIDNIVIYDNITYDKAPPEWAPAPVDQMIDYGTDFRYDLNATDFSGLGTWSINDTTNFAIDSNGVVTNVVDLEVARYTLNVSVSDSQGYARSAVFDVVVRQLFGSDLTLYLLAGGAGVVIVALVVLFMRRRG
ncbi:MAG: hypothetical protein ACFFCP_12365 [Promethearchaeota archaeon]